MSGSPYMGYGGNGALWEGLVYRPLFSASMKQFNRYDQRQTV